MHYKLKRPVNGFNEFKRERLSVREVEIKPQSSLTIRCSPSGPFKEILHLKIHGFDLDDLTLEVSHFGLADIKIVRGKR